MKTLQNYVSTWGYDNRYSTSFLRSNFLGTRGSLYCVSFSRTLEDRWFTSAKFDHLCKSRSKISRVYYFSRNTR